MAKHIRNLSGLKGYGFSISIVVLFILLLTVSSGIKAQNTPGLQYISPEPGSKDISIYSNIIIRFNLPINPTNDISQIISITNGDITIPFHQIAQNDPNKIILKTDALLPLNSIINVESSTPISTGNGSAIAPFQFQFSTYSSNRFDYVQNENWMNTTQPIQKTVSNLIIKETGNVTATSTRTIQTDFINQLPFDMSTSEGDPDDYFFIGSMLSPGNKDRCMIVNGLGQLIYERRTQNMTLNFRMFEDTTFCFANVSSKAEETGFIVMDKNFKDIDTIKAGNGYNTDIHELVKDMRTGHYFLLAQRVIEVDMSNIISNGRTDAKLLDLVVQEIDEKKNVLFEWKCFDHLPVSDSYGVDLTEVGPIDYIHCNSIMLDSDTTLLLSSRHFCEVTRIDRRTGNIIWRFGPHASTDNFLFNNDPNGFTYQHHAQKLPNGNILLFDNGNFKYGYRYSRAVEYRLNEETMRAEKVWEYRHTPDIITDFMGSVQRLPNGNTVIGWGSANPNFTEVDESGKVLNEGSLPQNILSYRVFKYHIPELITKFQPKFSLPDNYTFCKLRDHNFENKTKIYLQPFVQGEITPEFQSLNIVNNNLSMTLEDTLNHFYSYNNRNINYTYVDLAQKDTVVCQGTGLYKINLNDGCQNSSYLWSNGATSAQINYPTTEDLNKIWVITTNGLLMQTDSLSLNVTPVSKVEILGDPVLTKPYQIYSYSLPYFKGATYSWKVINGNIISGYESNSVQVQWGNKSEAYLKATITDSYGCVNSTPWDTIAYLKNGTGVEELAEKIGVKVFPSPFHDLINLEGSSSFTFALFDLSGKQLIESKGELNGNTAIPTSELPAAIYILKVNSGNNQVYVKLFKN